MGKNQKAISMYVIYALLIVGIIVSVFFLAPRTLEIKEGYTYFSEQVGYSNGLDFGDINNVNTETVYIDERLIRSDTLLRMEDGIAVIENNYQGFNKFNEQTFNSSNVYAVDRYTKENVPAEGVEDAPGYFTFPPHVEKKDYLFSSPEVVEQPEKVVFKSEERVRGLSVYRFDYEIPKVDKSHFFPESITNIGSVKGDHKGSLWVEPTTGYIVNFSHGGENFIHDQDTDEEIMFFQNWENGFTEDTVDRHVKAAKQIKSQYNLYSRTVPLILFVIGFVLVYRSRKDG